MASIGEAMKRFHLVARFKQSSDDYSPLIPKRRSTTKRHGYGKVLRSRKRQNRKLFMRKHTIQVSVLCENELAVFEVESRVLNHPIVQCLLKKTETFEHFGRSERNRAVTLQCDPLLFEHILWLLDNEDPCLRSLNLEELMEFYA